MDRQSVYVCRVLLRASSMHGPSRSPSVFIQWNRWGASCRAARMPYSMPSCCFCAVFLQCCRVEQGPGAETASQPTHQRHRTCRNSIAAMALHSPANDGCFCGGLVAGCAASLLVGRCTAPPHAETFPPRPRTAGEIAPPAREAHLQPRCGRRAPSQRGRARLCPPLASAFAAWGEWVTGATASHRFPQQWQFRRAPRSRQADDEEKRALACRHAPGIPSSPFCSPRRSFPVAAWRHPFRF